MRYVISLILLTAILCIPTSSLAQDSILPVFVEPFEGPGARGVRNEVVRVVDGIDATESISGNSARTRVGVVRIRGTLTRTGRQLSLDLQVYRAEDDLVGDVQASGRNPGQLVRTLRRALANELAPLLADARQAPEADGDPINIVVRDFLGPQSAQIRDAVLSRIATRRRITVIPVRAPMTRPEDYVRVAQEQQIAAFLEGDITAIRVTDQRQGLSLVISVRDGQSGEPIAEVRVRGSNLSALRRALQQEFWPQISGVLRDARAPEAPAEEAPEAPFVLETDEEQAARAEGRPSPLQASLGIRMFSRNFEYNDDIFQQLSGYELGAGASLVFELTWYPLAHFRDGWLAHIGIQAGLDSSLGLSSRGQDSSYETSSRDWSVGLVGRVPIGRSEIGLGVSFGNQAFTLDDEESLPDVDYQFLRYGVSGRVAVLDSLFVEAGFGWRQLLSSGELDRVQWFPRNDGAGIDALLGVGYQMTESWGLHASVELRRYFFSLLPAPGDAWIAGGLLDQYWSGSLRLSYRWPEHEADTELDSADSDGESE